MAATFNVSDLSPYVKGKIGYGDLRANPFNGGEDGVDQSLVQDHQPESGSSMLTSYHNEQFCEGTQCSFAACLGDPCSARYL